ncbi:MAG: glutamate 5-kinase [Clostridiales bacterium]|jgi:glutamate 5-kinase|nr:glutamate 5-kinase [Eubacteriales bacterium]MDD3196809.1 glutamate 5-kinase [Eubacteriales bacterium]MDD3503054.1 glutamate 5-kinase [Eubacteriales bacterium]MDD4682535.1 glutamate 5-kinase [Eubacteriales bacterium]MDN5313824.1 glutamate 5-kinase [Clostridiales bacterium]
MVAQQQLRERIKQAERIVIKVGTSTLTYDNGRINLTNMDHLCRSVSNLMNKGKQVILVSSGAIGVGVGRLRLPEKPASIRHKQAVAAVGQCELMKTYSRLMSDYTYTVGQVLLTKDDIDDQQTRANIVNTFEALLEMEIVPIVNENDTVSTREIYHNGTFGDNDTLSAIVAVLVEADLLIMLTDIDGLYDSDPRINKDAVFVSYVPEITDEIESSAGSEGSKRGTGGMRSKILAARIATVAGLDAIIANGSAPNVIDDIADGKSIGTMFAGLRD